LQSTAASMLTGEIRSQIDRIWNAFWTGGISNPLEVIEQIAYLLFLRCLDEIQEVEERKAARVGKPVERQIFPAREIPANGWRAALHFLTLEPCRTIVADNES
jgi:hypothetical protein